MGAQAFLKVKIMDNIHKYYYLIVFTAYMREMAEVARTTMTDELRENIAESKLSYEIMDDAAQAFLKVKIMERDIPAAALANLEKLASGDFKANLGKIIHDIYQT